jgi:hypothetical protein
MDGKSRRVLAGVTAGLFALAGAACERADETTGVHVTVHFDGMMIEQLAFTVFQPGREPLQALRPSTFTPGRWLASPQDVVIFMPESMAGQIVGCDAKGVAMGAPLPAQGHVDSTLERDRLVPATIMLAAAAPAPPPAMAPPEPPPAAMPAPAMPCPESDEDDGEDDDDKGKGKGGVRCDDGRPAD